MYSQKGNDIQSGDEGRVVSFGFGVDVGAVGTVVVMGWMR